MAKNDKKPKAAGGTKAAKGGASSSQVSREGAGPELSDTAPSEPVASLSDEGTTPTVAVTSASVALGLLLTTQQLEGGSLLPEPESAVVEVSIDLTQLDGDQIRALRAFLSDIPNTFKVLAIGKSPRPGGP